MSKIVNAELDRIVPNHFRMLENYPYSEEKLTALESSIEESGFWEGVIARSSGNDFEIAFGHHRIEAARRLKLNAVPLVIRELTDLQMLQLMGRENMEDYHTSFLVQLNTWEAAHNHFSSIDEKTDNQKIAETLGWKSKKIVNNKQYEELNITARATSAALELVKSGLVERSEFEGLPITTAVRIVEKAQGRIKQMQRTAESQNLSEKLVQEAKQNIGTAVKETTRQAREGKVAQRDLAATVDINIFGAENEAKRQEPLFKKFGTTFADSIGKMLKDDVAVLKLDEIAKVLGRLELEEDKQTLKRIDFELRSLIERAESWCRILSKKPAAVVPFKVLANRGEQKYVS